MSYDQHDDRRAEWVYATADGSQVLTVKVPFGLICPPTIDLHKPSVGPVTFFHADSYKIEIQPNAAEGNTR